MSRASPPPPGVAATSAIREDEVSLGRVSGVFGIRGEVRLFLHNRDSDLLATERDVTLLLPRGQRQAARLRTRSGAGKRVLGEIRGVTTPEAAQALVDAEILFPKAALPALEEDTYYHHQLLGLPVRTESGLELGKIAEIYAASSTPGADTDIWVVRGPDGESFIPAVADQILAIDLASGIVVTDEDDAGSEDDADSEDDAGFEDDAESEE